MGIRRIINQNNHHEKNICWISKSMPSRGADSSGCVGFIFSGFSFGNFHLCIDNVVFYTDGSNIIVSIFDKTQKP